MRSALIAMAVLTLVTAGCGDTTFIVRVNTGVIISNPSCNNGNGQFSLRDQGGLVLLVVVNDGTTIFIAGGSSGRCTDLKTGAHVEVSGPQDGTTITAESIHVV